MQKLALSRDVLLGQWELKKHGFQPTNGTFVPTAPAMMGRLIYAADGAMSVLITKCANPKEASDLIAYSGYFSIDEMGIYHHIEVSVDPKRIGRKELRIPSLQNDILTLKMAVSAEGHYEIVWRKMHIS